MKQTLTQILSKRLVHQALQGIAAGGISRLSNEGVPVLPIMYGGIKYYFNHSIEKEGLMKAAYPFEKYSTIKKIGWYTSGVAISRADQIYFAMRPMIE